MTNITNNNKDDFNDNEDEVDEVRSQKCSGILGEDVLL